MGLSINIGMLAFLLENDVEGAEHFSESLDQVNEVLAEFDLPLHQEPKETIGFDNRTAVRSFPYSFLHYLRRFAAHAATIPGWVPVPFPEDDQATADPILDDVLSDCSSHLICHSDCQGFYVPVEFPRPLYPASDQLEGGILGSSYGLVRELIAVAPFLGIQLSDGILADAEAERINQIGETEGPFFIEHIVWIALFEAARLSIKHRVAICFG